MVSRSFLSCAVLTILYLTTHTARCKTSKEETVGLEWQLLTSSSGGSAPHLEYESCRAVSNAPLQGGKLTIFLTSRCPENFTSSFIRRKCQETEKVTSSFSEVGDIPVSSLEGRRTFANTYCALCHGLGEADFVSWSTIEECTKGNAIFDSLFHLGLNTSNIDHPVLQNQVSLDDLVHCFKRRFIPPTFVHLINCTNPENIIVTKRMDSGIKNWKKSRIEYTYRNNHVPDQPLRRINHQTISGPSVPSFAMLLNFGFDGRRHILFENADGERWFAVCDNGFSLEGDICLRTGTVKMPVYHPNDDKIFAVNITINVGLNLLNHLENFRFQLKFQLGKILNIDPSNIQNITVADPLDDINKTIRLGGLDIDQLIKSHNLTFWEKLLKNHENSDNLTTEEWITKFITDKSQWVYPWGELINNTLNWDGKFKVNVSFLITRSPRFSNASLSVETRLENIEDQNNVLLNIGDQQVIITNVLFTETKVNDSTLSNWCRNGASSFYKNNEFMALSKFSVEKNRNVTCVYVNETGRIYEEGEFDLSLMLESTSGEFNITQFLFVCDELPTCNKSIIPLDAFERFNKTHIQMGTQMLGPSEHLIKNNSAIICDYGIAPRVIKLAAGCNSDMFFKFTLASRYLTIILGSLSVAGLICTLITYGLFDSLRNLPGWNLVNFAIGLLCGLLVFLTMAAHSNDKVCTAAAVLLHYFFLVVFFWMSVMAFDVWRTFGCSKSIMTRVRPWKGILPKYAAYAWGCPVLITSICTAIDFSGSQQFKIGYGRAAGFCWISDATAAMVAFGAPTFIILGVNMVLFCKTILTIRRTTRSADLQERRRRSIVRLTGKHDVIMYVRLASMLGFVWLFGVASVVTSSFVTEASDAICSVLHVLQLLFTGLATSQGIFLFASFVCTRRVLYMWKGWLRRRLSKKPPPAQRFKVSSCLTAYSAHGSLSTVASSIPDINNLEASRK